MTTSTDLDSLLSTEKLSLVPISLHCPDQYAEFKRQRVLCGWDFSDEDLQAFIEKQEKKLKSLFWITIQQQENNDDHPKSSNNVTQDAPVQPTAVSPSTTLVTPLRAGHISLDAYASPPDPELALADKSILIVQTFFVLPEYRTIGLGRAAMDLIEILATKEPYGSPQCHTLTLTTVSKKYVETEDPEWRGVWKKCGMEVPPFSNESWYEKLGYVYWKEEPRYAVRALDGSLIIETVESLHLDDPKKILETAGKETGVSKQILLYSIMRSIGGCTTKVERMHETLDGLIKIKSSIAKSEI